MQVRLLRSGNICLEFSEVPSSWALLRNRFRPRKLRRYKLPALTAYLLNVTILYSMSRQRAAQRITDIYFNPPLERVGLLDGLRSQPPTDSAKS